MPIRGFDHLSQMGNILKLPISVLNDTAIAIDGFWYIRKYHPGYQTSEILNFDANLEVLLRPLCDLAAHTQILWVWDGLDYGKCKPTRDILAFKAKDTVQRLNSNLAARNTFDIELYVQPTTNLLQQSGISVIRAPYSAMAQCVYFLRENCVKYVFSKNDALLFTDCSKLVTEILFNNSLIEVIDRNVFLKLNSLNLESFQSISLLSGCEVCPTVPMFANSFNIADIIELIKRGEIAKELEEYYKNKYKDELFEGSEERVYLSTYLRAFLIFVYHPVMMLCGRVECLEMHGIPSDLDKLFGKPLPHKMYHELFLCRMSPILLNKTARGEVFGVPYKDEILKAFRERIKPFLKPELSPELKLDSMEIAKTQHMGFSGDVPEMHLLARVQADLSDALNVSLKTINAPESLDPFLKLIYIKLYQNEVEPELLIGLLNNEITDKPNGNKDTFVIIIDEERLLIYLTVLDFAIILNDLVYLLTLISPDSEKWSRGPLWIKFSEIFGPCHQEKLLQIRDELLERNRGMFKMPN